MEWLDIYNEAGQPTGRRIRRDDPVNEGERLLVVHVCLMNSRGEMLIQKRQIWKDRFPGCWDISAGGFALAGENSQQAVLRELQEELGLVLPSEKLRFLLREPFSYVLDDFFLAYSDEQAESFTPQPEEVSEVRWASGDEVMAMQEDGRFVNYSAELLERIFAAV